MITAVKESFKGGTSVKLLSLISKRQKREYIGTYLSVESSILNCLENVSFKNSMHYVCVTQILFPLQSLASC